MPGQRWNQQELSQIASEQMNGLFFSILGQEIPNLALHGWEQQALATVLHRFSDVGLPQRRGTENCTENQLGETLLGNFKMNLERFFCFAAIDGENAVGRHVIDSLPVFLIVQELGGFIFRYGQSRRQSGGFPNFTSQQRPQIRPLGDGFSDNIAGAGQSGFRIFHAGFGIDEFGCDSQTVVARRIGLGQHPFRQRFQAFFPGDLGPGSFLGAERQIQVFELLQLLDGFNGGCQFGGQFALGFDCGTNFLLTFADVAEVLHSFINGTDLFLVKVSSGFFAIASDKWNGIAAIEQFDHRYGLLRSDPEFAGDHGRNFSKFHGTLLVVIK